MVCFSNDVRKVGAEGLTLRIPWLAQALINQASRFCVPCVCQAIGNAFVWVAYCTIMLQD